MIRRALDLKAALDLGITITLEEIRADEFAALKILQQERDALDREQMNHGRQE